MSMDDALLEPFERLLAQASPPEAVRREEARGDGVAIWSTIAESGFADALVAESDGGVGLAPADVAPLLIACGRHLLPVAFGETMFARALASAAGTPLPVDGPVLLWPADAAGKLRSLVAPAVAGAGHALVQQGGRVALRPLVRTNADPDGFGIVGARIEHDADPAIGFDLAEDVLFRWSVALTAATMAGAMGRVLDMTLTHVNDRQQFGRPLGKFQAIQQQISVLAEQVATANVAARVAFSAQLTAPSEFGAAVGKTIMDEAATTACAIAHAAHGAIGITREHDLPLFTRRLKRWQLSFGSAAYWSRRLGEARVTDTGGSVDFLRAHREL